MPWQRILSNKFFLELILYFTYLTILSANDSQMTMMSVGFTEFNSDVPNGSMANFECYEFTVLDFVEFDQLGFLPAFPEKNIFPAIEFLSYIKGSRNTFDGTVSTENKYLSTNEELRALTLRLGYEKMLLGVIPKSIIGIDIRPSLYMGIGFTRTTSFAHFPNVNSNTDWIDDNYKPRYLLWVLPEIKIGFRIFTLSLWEPDEKDEGFMPRISIGWSPWYTTYQISLGGTFQ